MEATNKETAAVQRFYDESVSVEWERLNRHPVEWYITTHYLDRYLHAGDRVLDIGGGPGRYSLYLAKRGCQMTLLDLSGGNVAFAMDQARQQRVSLLAMRGDARQADQLVPTEPLYDAVLLMGPLYHLEKEADRRQSVLAALRLLRPGGLLFCSFISLNAAVIDAMKSVPEIVLNPLEAPYLDCFRRGVGYAGPGFTTMATATPEEIRAFLSEFPRLELCCLFGQEGFLSPCEDRLIQQPKEILDAWLELALATCERPDCYACSEHLMAVCRKR